MVGLYENRVDRRDSTRRDCVECAGYALNLRTFYFHPFRHAEFIRGFLEELGPQSAWLDKCDWVFR